MVAPLRFGLLGAARITPEALIKPAAEVDGVELVAVAARDQDRAKAFAAEHGIRKAVASYADLVADPEVDAVYNPLPMSLHHSWTIAALRHGKHVLCEKPFASNAAEAAEMVAVGQETGMVLCEAFHWRYHPMAERLRELLREGAVGTVRKLDAVFTAPITDQTDIRYDLALAGGATMDLGCYPISWVRTLVGEEPEVVSATAEQGLPGIDVTMTGELRFPGGATARVHTSMASNSQIAAMVTVEGDRGRLRAVNPLAPHLGNAIIVQPTDGDERRESVEGKSTYYHQLVAFAAAVREGASLPTGGNDAIHNMRVIDALYTAAGLPIRGEL